MFLPYRYVNVTIGKQHQYMSEPYSREDELDKVFLK